MKPGNSTIHELLNSVLILDFILVGCDGELFCSEEGAGGSRLWGVWGWWFILSYMRNISVAIQGLVLFCGLCFLVVV